jgi:hypothetical protein
MRRGSGKTRPSSRVLLAKCFRNRRKRSPETATPTSFARRPGSDWPQASARGRRLSGRFGCMREHFA